MRRLGKVRGRGRRPGGVQVVIRTADGPSY